MILQYINDCDGLNEYNYKYIFVYYHKYIFKFEKP